MVFRDPIVPGAISCIGRLLYATSHVKESLNPFRHAPATSCRRSYPFSVEYCTERVASCPVSDARCVANPTLNAVLACASRLMSKAFVSVIQSPVRMHPRRSFPLHPDLPPPTLLHDTRMRIGFLLFSVRLLLARTGEKDTKSSRPPPCAPYPILGSRSNRGSSSTPPDSSNRFCHKLCTSSCHTHHGDGHVHQNHATLGKFRAPRAAWAASLAHE